MCVVSRRHCPQTQWTTGQTGVDTLYLLDTDIFLFYQMLFKTQRNHGCVLVLLCCVVGLVKTKREPTLTGHLYGQTISFTCSYSIWTG